MPPPGGMRAYAGNPIKFRLAGHVGPAACEVEQSLGIQVSP